MSKAPTTKAPAAKAPGLSADMMARKKKPAEPLPSFGNVPKVTYRPTPEAHERLRVFCFNANRSKQEVLDTALSFYLDAQDA